MAEVRSRSYSRSSTRLRHPPPRRPPLAPPAFPPPLSAHNMPPGDHEPFDRPRGTGQRDDRGQQHRGEDQVGPEAVLRQLHPDPEAAGGPDVLAEDRADDRVDHADPQAGEEGRQGRRPAQAPERLGRCRAHRPHQVHRRGLDAPEPVEQHDGHREERHEHDDDDLRQQAEPEPDHEQRGDGDDRDGLARDEQRLDRAPDRRHRSSAIAAAIASATETVTPTMVSTSVGTRCDRRRRGNPRAPRARGGRRQRDRVEPGQPDIPLPASATSAR